MMRQVFIGGEHVYVDQGPSHCIARRMEAIGATAGTGKGRAARYVGFHAYQVDSVSKTLDKQKAEAFEDIEGYGRRGTR